MDTHPKMIHILTYRLFSPWRFWFIRDESKLLYVLNWVFPLLLSFFITIVIKGFCLYSDSLSMSKLWKDMLKLVENSNFLPGFFIAALAAIAVFDKNSMDEILPGAKLFYTDIDGRRVELTRRRLLCMLFSFLSAQSFCLIALTQVVDNIFGSYCNHKCDNTVFSYMSLKEALLSDWPFVISYFMILFFYIQILIVMLYGMYYLGERIHYKN